MPTLIYKSKAKSVKVCWTNEPAPKDQDLLGLFLSNLLESLGSNQSFVLAKALTYTLPDDEIADCEDDDPLKLAEKALFEAAEALAQAWDDSIAKALAR